MNQSCCTRSVLSVTLAAALRITSQFTTTFSVIWISRFKNEMQGMKQRKKSLRYPLIKLLQYYDVLQSYLDNSKYVCSQCQS